MKRYPSLNVSIIQLWFLVTLFHCISAVAQTPSETILAETKPIVQSERGKVRTCGVEFSAFVADLPYKMGGYVMLRGSVNLMYIKGQTPTVLFKLQTAEVIESSNKEPQAIPFTPGYAYFMTYNIASAGKEMSSFECEGGGWCGAYPGTELNLLELAMGAVQGLPFSVAYIRPSGSTDVIAAIPGKQFVEMPDCIEKLFKRFEAQD